MGIEKTDTALASLVSFIRRTAKDKTKSIDLVTQKNESHAKRSTDNNIRCLYIKENRNYEYNSMVYKKAPHYLYENIQTGY